MAGSSSVTGSSLGSSLSNGKPSTVSEEAQTTFFKPMAQAAWKTYVNKELGLTFMAPGEVKTSLGTFRGNYAGPRQTIVYRSVEDNIEYKVTVMSFVQAQAEGFAVGFTQRLLGRELFIEQLLHHVHVDVQHGNQSARVRDVFHEDALARIVEVLVAHL